ncbi:MAG: hypothetical protein ACRD4O_01945, partial [Bryobacteraceae bacterium]
AAALPFSGRRKWAVTASLLAIAFGLFTVRYFKIETLSLRPPLVPVPIAALLDVERLFSPHTESVPLMRRSLPLKGVSQTAHAGQQPRGSDASEANADSSSGTVPGKAAKPNTNQNQRASAAGANPDAGRPDTTSSPSLLQRMKAALASLASDLRAHVAGKRSPHGDSQAKATRSLAQTQPSGSRQASAQRGANTQAKAVQKQGASLRNSQASSRKGSEAKSGIGSQNGEKDLRRAEELAAMGKLAEILGKRSADLTGEMTVRSVSGTAALRTRDTRRLGRHEDLGGEIQRNEVPPMYRDYVRRYMEEARKVAEQSAK